MSENEIPESLERQHGAGTYQMLWDCRFCGTEKLLGLDHRHCPNCGAAQDPAWRYFPSEADMVAVEDHRYVGADRICPACSQPNSAAASFCAACGADLATGQVAGVQAARDLDTAGAASSTQRDVVLEQHQAEMARIGADKPGRSTERNKWLIIGALLALLVICGGIIYAVTYRKAGTGTIQAASWERVIEIEQLVPVDGSAWDERVPNDAYDISCRERQRETREVAVGSHEECQDVDQGDGSFRRECRSVTDYESEPVYDSWCDYTVNTWTTTRSVHAGGDERAVAPAWPTLNLSAASGSRGLGAERESRRREVYQVVIDVDGKQHVCEVPDLAAWQQYREGQSISVKLTATGSVDCDSLQAP